MPKPNQIRSLNFKEIFDAYVIPYYIFVMGGRWAFNKRFNKEFIKRVQKFEHFGEINIAKEFNELRGVAMRNF